MVSRDELQKIVQRVQNGNGVVFSEISNPIFKKSAKYTICHIEKIRCNADIPPFDRVTCSGESTGVAAKMDCDKDVPEVGQGVAFRHALEEFVLRNFEINTVKIAVPINNDKETKG